MEFLVLGPLEVRAAGVDLALGTRKQQVALALLLLHANRVVTVDELVDELWPLGPPDSAVANVRGYVGRLRRLFTSVEPGRDRLVRHGRGYLLSADADENDLAVFAAHAAAGRDELRRGEAKAAAARFGDALACWRGPMLAGLPRGPALAARCAAVEDQRLTLVEELAAARLQLDEPRAVVGLLRDHVPAHPLRERGRLLLMRALYRLGDATAALAVFAEGRTAVAEQLGLEPGPALQELHRTILARQPERARAAPARGPVPAQLPLDVFGFTGRDSELGQLDAVLAASGEQPTAVVISAIAGTAGVGKTATAVHWAHRVREEFPDGQLYVNLRGFDPSGTPTSPTEAVRGFLDALDVPPARIPSDVEAQAGLYRSLLASRRMLVVLDNARDAEQVRPLLPGSPGCLVVVTSRNQLTGLVAAEGAHPITLDLLTTAEARALLTRRLGADRMAAEPDAIDDIITRCARLPLALAIVAARAAARPTLPLAAMAGGLRGTRQALDALTTDEIVTDLRAVFSWSYHAVSSAAARMFRLLGLHPGPDISTAAAASLAGIPAEKVRPLLEQLIRTNLITEAAAGRYALHDLLRAYAADRAHADDTDAERRAALHRVLDHYLHTGNFAIRALDPYSDQLPLRPARPGVTYEKPAGSDGVFAWFSAERRNIQAAIARAAQLGLDIHTWQLAVTTSRFFSGNGHWPDLMTSLNTALDATRRLGDRSAQATVHLRMIACLSYMDNFDDAHSHFGAAKKLYEELDDRTAQGLLSQEMAVLASAQGRYADGLFYSQQALDAFRVTGSRHWEARALNGIGWFQSHLGNHAEAVAPLQECTAIQQEINDRWGQVGSWDSLGFVYHQLGQFDRAVSCYERSIEVTRAFGQRQFEVMSVDRLGDTHLAAGDVAAARECWDLALAIYDDLGLPEAEMISAKLYRLAEDEETGGRTRPS